MEVLERGMLDIGCRFGEGSAEDRRVADCGIPVCTGTSGGHRQDCSVVLRTGCYTFSLKL